MSEIEKGTSIAESIDFLGEQIHIWARNKGFWTFPQPLDPGLEVQQEYLIKSTKIVLVITELAELVEGLRKPADSSIPGFTNEEEEIADAVIRIFDYAARYKLNLGQAILAKMEVNSGRPFRHGKAF